MSKILHVVCLYDAHCKHDGIKEPYKLARNYVAAVQPDITVIGGDFGEFMSMSYFDKDKIETIEGIRYKDEVEVINNELDILQRYSGKVVYLEGNHEERIEKYIEEKPSARRGVDDLQILLKLKQRKIEWYHYNQVDRKGNIQKHNYELGKLNLQHGWKCGKYYALNTLYQIGTNIMVGHAHLSQMATLNMIKHLPYKCWGIGCLCNKWARFVRGGAAFDNGFAEVYVNKVTGRFNVNVIDIIDNTFMKDGREYK